ncbi:MULTISPECIES: hypothetical protein [unclassified Endozoicomonas]|uniref:hypothetical protein n=1 Tax=unclassified Endozoicomonas TaxID=2644528 RepID=UPI003BB5E644
MIILVSLPLTIFCVLCIGITLVAAPSLLYASGIIVKFLVPSVISDCAALDANYRAGKLALREVSFGAQLLKRYHQSFLLSGGGGSIVVSIRFGGLTTAKGFKSGGLGN